MLQQWWSVSTGAQRVRRAARQLAPYACLAAAWIGYNLWSERWGFVWLSSQAWTELPLLLAAYAGAMQLLRPRRWRPVIAALPIAVLYAGSDYYQLLALRPADWYDLVLLPQLVSVLSITQWSLLLALGALPLFAFLAQLDLRAFTGRRVFVLVMPVLMALSIKLLPVQVMRMATGALALEGWSDVHESACHGRLVMSLVREARRRQTAVRLATYRPLESSSLWLTPAFMQQLEHRNVIMVLLEGYFDLRRLASVRFSRPPFHDDFLRRAGANLSTSISPAFGSGTARAEFELLCGVPALGLVGSEEFNAFTGSPTYCLPTILRGAGYSTVVFDLGGPRYYNAVRAHESLGFAKVLYPDTDVAPGTDAIDTRNKQTEWLFDGDLYRQVLARLRADVTTGRSMFYFVVTMYGHIPFELEEGTQPKVITTSPSEPVLDLLANQSYYRSKAIIDFVDGVAAIDPQAIVVFAADHAPPMPQGEQDYARLGCGGGAAADAEADTRLHEVPLLLYDRGAFVKLPLVHHFDVPALILDRLSGGRHCANKHRVFGGADVDLEPYVDDYLTIIGLGARPAGQ